MYLPLGRFISSVKATSKLSSQRNAVKSISYIFLQQSLGVEELYTSHPAILLLEAALCEILLKQGCKVHAKHASLRLKLFCWVVPWRRKVHLN